MGNTLLDALNRGGILANLEASDKASVLKELLGLPAQGLGLPMESLIAAVMEREKLGSTGIGGGIAFPHGRIASISEGILVFGKSRKGLPFDAMDGRPVHLFFLVLTPADMPDLHLEILGQVSKFLRTPGVQEKLRMGKTSEEIFSIFLTA